MYLLFFPGTLLLKDVQSVFSFVSSFPLGFLLLGPLQNGLCILLYILQHMLKDDGYDNMYGIRLCHIVLG